MIRDPVCVYHAKSFTVNHERQQVWCGPRDPGRYVLNQQPLREYAHAKAVAQIVDFLKLAKDSFYASRGVTNSTFLSRTVEEARPSLENVAFRADIGALCRHVNHQYRIIEQQRQMSLLQGLTTTDFTVLTVLERMRLERHATYSTVGFGARTSMGMNTASTQSAHDIDEGNQHPTTTHHAIQPVTYGGTVHYLPLSLAPASPHPTTSPASTATTGFTPSPHRRRPDNDPYDPAHRALVRARASQPSPGTSPHPPIGAERTAAQAAGMTVAAFLRGNTTVRGNTPDSIPAAGRVAPSGLTTEKEKEKEREMERVVVAVVKPAAVTRPAPMRVVDPAEEFRRRVTGRGIRVGFAVEVEGEMKEIEETAAACAAGEGDAGPTSAAE